MVLTMIVKQTEDGYTAEVPTLKGCESWAHDPDTVIDKTLDLVAYYLKLEHSYFAVDLIRKQNKKITYKIIFNKP